MKNILGCFLFVSGIGGYVIAVQKDASIWIVMLIAISIVLGLELIIESKIEEAMKKLGEELREEFGRE